MFIKLAGNYCLKEVMMYMRHPVLLTLSFFLIAFFTLLQLNIDYQVASPTGGAIVEQEAESAHYAVALDHVVTDFFSVNAIEFPSGSCGDVARDLYSTVAFTSIDVSSGFGTTGVEGVSTLNFVIDRTARYGTMDLAKGKSIVGDKYSTSFISLNTETIVRVPKEVRTTYFSLDLYGTSGSTFQVDRGRFSTPSVDCDFLSSPEGIAVCNCNAHSISGIRVAGITGIRSV